MSNERNNQADRGDRDPSLNRTESRSSVPNDLPDSTEDRKKLQPEETTIELPDVKDIPGQEFVHVPPAGMMADTTIASAGEEGSRVFDREDADSRTRTGSDFDVSPEERSALEKTEYMPTTDEDNLQRAALDNTDFQGEALNEKSFGEETSGDDLDIPDETDETRTDAMGQGDEENKLYSLGSDNNDNVTEGTP
jgi:hypothetical protein